MTDRFDSSDEEEEKGIDDVENADPFVTTVVTQSWSVRPRAGQNVSVSKVQDFR